MSEGSVEGAMAPVQAETGVAQGPVVVSREDFMAVQLMNGEGQQLTLEFKILALQSEALTKKKEEFFSRQSGLMQELNKRYGVNFAECDVDPVTREVRRAGPRLPQGLPLQGAPFAKGG